jgi:hypothetical protein
MEVGKRNAESELSSRRDFNTEKYDLPNNKIIENK